MLATLRACNYDPVECISTYFTVGETGKEFLQDLAPAKPIHKMLYIIYMILQVFLVFSDVSKTLQFVEAHKKLTILKINASLVVLLVKNAIKDHS